MPESIAHYRIGPKLGQGAMGEVYRATDTKLGRDVAIKLIAPALAGDESRLASFTREAQVLASLNHPNIAAIYGVEDHALVMELVEGPTLADRIKQGPIPLDEALGIARQIAEGLAAAHDRGIVHRDLKPANIKITPDGTVKLLDFGLARAAAFAATAADDAATVALSMVGGSEIAGTPGYMAPEQARGQALDKRADIWAFGVVLYEMLTGTMLFTGATTTDVLAAVVREEPDLSRVPAMVRPVLRRCLEKDPKRRLRDVGDAILLLETAQELPAGESRSPVLRAWLPWMAAAAGVVAFLALLAIHLREATPAAQTLRFKITVPPELTVQQTTPFVVSGDGRALAFPAVGSDGVSRLWLQEFNAIEPRVLAGTESSGGMLFWAHDNRSILYSQGRKMKRVDVSGGPATELGDIPQPGIGFTMNRDGVIVYGTPDGLVRANTFGATPTLITKATPEALHAPVQFLPDGRRVLYGRGGAPGSRAVYVASIDAAPDAQPKDPIVKTDFFAVFVPTRTSDADGQLLTVRENTLMAQRFDSGSLQLKGEPRPIADNVFVVNSVGAFGLAFFTVSDEGTLVYRTGTLADRLSRQLALIRRDGQTQKTFAELGRFNQVKLSPDGKKAVTSRTELETGNFADLWITDLDAETSTKFTFGGGANVQPVWSPDGQWIAWARAREKDTVVYRKSADGAGAEEELVTLPERRNINMSDWTSDGAFLIYSFGGDVFALPVTSSDRKPIPIAATKASEFGASVSPNRRWIAYISNESSRQEVYVQPFTPGSPGTPVGKWLVSRGTTGLIRWRADSGELVFLSPDGELMSVDVTAAPVFKASAPKALFQMPRPFLVQAGNPGALADTSRDLQRLILAVPSESSRRQELSVVINWPNSLQPAGPRP
jgi:eukaryotic-like serine/threonine-protein kinase